MFNYHGVSTLIGSASTPKMESGTNTLQTQHAQSQHVPAFPIAKGFDSPQQFFIGDEPDEEQERAKLRAGVESWNSIQRKQRLRL